MTNDIYTLTVSKFNNIVKNIFLNEELLHNVKIVGEVFGVSLSKTATYFSVKDEESSLPCVCFDSSVLQGVKEGDLVIVTGSPNFYAKSGRFNFVVSKVEQSGQGLLFQRFVELKNRLEKEGLFDVALKKSLPKSIKRIGVVTSKEGAVLQDIKNVTWRRNPGIDIVLYDCKVQGNGAEQEIAAGIDFFSDYDNVDVVVVARGGGSLEDLAAFNTETVARATFACKKPIVSAVGHETDFTIIDFVSDLRAPTPSAAAELLTKDTKNLTEDFQKNVLRIKRHLDNFLAEKQMCFQGECASLIEKLDDFVEKRKTELEKSFQKAANLLDSFVKDAEFSLQLKLAKLKNLNPLDILRLGYAKIEQQGMTVARMKDLDLDKTIEINFADGRVDIVANKHE